MSRLSPLLALALLGCPEPPKGDPEDTSDTVDGDGDTDGDTDAPTGDVDADGDGFSANDGDCDDNDVDIHPSAVEVCDGIDNDCDDRIDDDDSSLDISTRTTFYADDDGDTYGSAENTVQACLLPAGYVDNDGDCDDTSGTVYPGAAEVEDISSCMRDADEDGWGDIVAPIGGIAGEDCDDNDAETNPAAIEDLFDTVDNNCNGKSDRKVSISIAGSTFLGEERRGQLGHSVSGAGDVNGDGLDDVLVAAYYEDADGIVDSGAAYVFLSPTHGEYSVIDADACFWGRVKTILLVQLWLALVILTLTDIQTFWLGHTE